MASHRVPDSRSHVSQHRLRHRPLGRAKDGLTRFLHRLPPTLFALLILAVVAAADVVLIIVLGR